MDKNIQMLIGKTNEELEVNKDTSCIELINYKHDTHKPDIISSIEPIFNNIELCLTNSSNKYVVFRNARKHIGYGILLNNKFNKINDFFEMLIFSNNGEKILKKINRQEVIYAKTIDAHNILLVTEKAYYMLQES